MEYLLHIAVMVCLYSILATSFNLLIGFAGLFALSQAAFYGLGAYTTAILLVDVGLPFPLPLIASAVVGAGVGTLLALPALRIVGDYLVVVTLAFQIILVEVAMNWTGLTGGTDGISGVPNYQVFGLSLDSPTSFLPVALLVAALCFWIAWRLATSPFGRSLRAMRENESAAVSVGKNVVAMKLVVFAFSAGLAAVAGSLFARYFNYVGADSFLIEETIYILAMVILGGAGNLVGSVLGAAILVILPELLKFIALPVDIADKSRLVLYGLVMVAILIYRPQGLLGERKTQARTRASSGPGGGEAAAVPLRASAGAAARGRTIEGRGLAKQFGGIVAISSLDIRLEPGTITGLIGPNGAGKTTAFNLLTGFLKPTGGEVLLDGSSTGALKPYELARAGVARSFQDLRLFTKMTVLENVLVALPGQVGDSVFSVYFRPAAVRRDEAANVRRAREVLAFVGLEEQLHETAENLSYAEEKLLVVARLLATGADVLLFDEPLSGLDGATLQEIFPVMRRLAESGKTVCIIEHNLDVIKELCSVVYYLDEGHAMAVGRPEELMADPELAERYFR
ncbi:amino acid/amide ABC transporter membrane protein 2, HAAT family /amino acid/amide ABC transporter ATP-binding protein 1, HAAT family [Tistlia consotensis]|uniref:Amino acid/amide ABC transporter membrane protein 2, HAAT family /amino acid/amide ABC transporter ATP-binding protein 1, HAAT family n=1 Tax=Tistlia consotensis USBA 355 TaxID=560819 RepID=A0A1Y6C2M4_9PROT|nr:branched-chain amino acid ABC transporter ATP-binding protein/permease [Tistlia consotensis]SMF30284.1 amino acid/amide ABC transporter membrane protein 2, HAAT family /amino acid/amide ABC transporter ATP-binding protein 1, HAAT family [Tistlia consotensis USBA 355]SNR90226.1 amino acid/amide ABC transporter membrane protein 2, HAAT family /amino acid/amide ABC transporter ATP-binding protein 1, HAAT family [Tistlia consotensis]